MSFFVLSIGNKRGTEIKEYKGNEISELSCMHGTSMLLFTDNVKVIDSFPINKTDMVQFLIWFIKWVFLLYRGTSVDKSPLSLLFINFSKLLVYRFMEHQPHSCIHAFHFTVLISVFINVWLDTVYKYQFKWVGVLVLFAWFSPGFLVFIGFVFEGVGVWFTVILDSLINDI